MVSYDLLFHSFTNFYPLPHGPKIIRLNKIYISTRKSSLSEVNFSPIWINTLVNLLLDTMNYSPVWFIIITNNISSNKSLTWWFHLFWFLYIDKHNVKRGRGKGDIQKLRHFKHKVNHKIGCYPKYLLVFPTYQVQGWCTIILSPVKSQLDVSNCWISIIVLSSWVIKPKTFI